MSSRDTQNKIIDAAIELFNLEEASQVSVNRIAEKAEISKGNLHYHFRSKEEIILLIWVRMEEEIKLWQGDHKQPTIHHMAEMMLRQYRLIWSYRFFYRELNSLLDQDTELKYRFKKMRQSRMEDVYKYFLALAENGVVRKDVTEEELRDLIRISWVISDFWISFVAVEEETIDTKTMQEGYRLILRLLKPILTTEAQKDIPESFQIFTTGEIGPPACNY